jgi:hypothetical protein
MKWVYSDKLTISDPPIVIWLSATSCLRIVKCKRRGMDKIDLRLWYKTQNMTEEMPTMKGIMIDLDLWNKEVFPALLEANKDKVAA